MDSGWIDIEQNSPDWELLRIGKITCSQLSILFMKESTKGFQRFIREKAFERLTGSKIEDKWKGDWTTEQGHDRESEGIRLYELETFRKVTKGGFWIYSDTVGGSPDGHCENGLVEVKSRTTEVWIEIICSNLKISHDELKTMSKEQVNNELRKKFKPSMAEWSQCIGQMLVSGRKWCDLVLTPPDNFLPFIYRIDRDETAIKELKDKLNYADELINKEQEKLKKFLR